MFDESTGLLSREALVDRLQQEVARSERYGLLCSLVLIRVTGYRPIVLDDPALAQRVLERMTWLIRLGSRRYDLAGRWTEDTFALLLPHVGKSGALIRIDRMRNAAAMPAEEGQPGVEFRASAVAFPETDHALVKLVAEAERQVGLD